MVSFADEGANIVRAPFSSTWPLETLCEYIFSGQDGKTRITMASVPFNVSDEERASFEQGHAGMIEGTNGILDELADYLTNVQA